MEHEETEGGSLAGMLALVIIIVGGIVLLGWAVFVGWAALVSDLGP